MKKILIFSFLFCLITNLSVAVSENQQSYIPKEISRFLDYHFDIYELDKIEYDADDNECEVKYKCGFQIEFEGGRWTSIKTKYQPLPKSVIDLLPIQAIRFISQKYPHKPVVKIKYKSKGTYQIALSDDTELIFDSEGRFIKKD